MTVGIALWFIGRNSWSRIIKLLTRGRIATSSVVMVSQFININNSDENMRTQRDEETCPKSHRQSKVEGHTLIISEK